MLLACLFSAATPSSSVKLLVSRETLQCLGCLLKLCSGGWFVLLASVKRVLVLVFFFFFLKTCSSIFKFAVLQHRQQGPPGGLARACQEMLK